LYLAFITNNVSSLDALKQLRAEELARLVPSADDRAKVAQLLTGGRNKSAGGTPLNAYGMPISASTPSTQQSKPSSTPADRIRVCVRTRPLSSKELSKNDPDITTLIPPSTLTVAEPKVKLDLTKYTDRHQFTFDDVFGPQCSNEMVYERTAAPLIQSVFDGGKATCFAYGQSGSGKTFTMLNSQNGLFVLACRDIFRLLSKDVYKDLGVFVSFYEIYQGHLYDLLHERKRVFAREDRHQNVVIQGLVELQVRKPDDLVNVFHHGSLSRSTGATGANDESSRSHAILQILLKRMTTQPKPKAVGKFSFIVSIKVFHSLIPLGFGRVRKGRR
jgi:hypothetical protein